MAAEFAEPSDRDPRIVWCSVGPLLAQHSSMHVPAIFAALLSLVLVRPDGGGDGERPPRPPAEALEACEELEAGDACSFEGRNDETVEGTCFTPGDDKPLACRPSNPPPGREGGEGQR